MYLACHPMDLGTPGHAASSRAGEVQPCRSSNQVTIRPPRRRHPHRAASPATQAQPPAAFRLTTGGPQLRHPPTAAVSDLDPDHAAGGPDRDRDRLPLRARAAVPDAVAEQLAHPAARRHPPHGCPGPSTPAANARATRARSARPATVTLSRICGPAISTPAFPAARPRQITGAPGRIYGNARSTHRLMSSRNPRPAGPVRGCPWKADGAHRPSWRPDAVRYMSVDSATQRSTAIQGDT
jgi:hypothetical protein